MENLSPNKKWTIINLALSSNKTNKTIARELKISPSTVTRIIHRWRERKSLENKPKSGRPRKIPKELISELDSIVVSNKDSPCSELNHLFKEKTRVDVSTRTIQRIRRMLRYRKRKKRTVLPLTLPQKHAYRNFCRLWKNDNKDFWIYTDECIVQLRNMGQWEWRKPGQEPGEFKIKNLRAFCMVWGAIWKGGKLLIPYKGYLNQRSYLRLLQTKIQPHLPRWRRHKFLQDNASFHWTQSVRNWFENHGVQLIRNPVKAPQINAIEYLWKDLKLYTRAQHPTNQSQLIKCIEKAGKKITRNQIRGYINHVDREMKKRSRWPITWFR